MSGGDSGGDFVSGVKETVKESAPYVVPALAVGAATAIGPAGVAAVLGVEQIGQAKRNKSDQASVVGEGEQRQRDIAAVSKDLADNSKNVDRNSTLEIQQALSSGDPAQAARILADARKGEGLYAIRKLSEAQKNLVDLYPGRSQTTSKYKIV
jgi:hypothetical protein